jgi:hypothetical protein
VWLLPSSPLLLTPRRHNGRPHDLPIGAIRRCSSHLYSIFLFIIDLLPRILAIFPPTTSCLLLPAPSSQRQSQVLAFHCSHWSGNPGLHGPRQPPQRYALCLARFSPLPRQRYALLSHGPTRDISRCDDPSASAGPSFQGPATILL